MSITDVLRVKGCSFLILLLNPCRPCNPTGSQWLMRSFNTNRVYSCVKNTCSGFCYNSRSPPAPPPRWSVKQKTSDCRSGRIYSNHRHVKSNVIHCFILNIILLVYLVYYNIVLHIHTITTGLIESVSNKVTGLDCTSGVLNKLLLLWRIVKDITWKKIWYSLTFKHLGSMNWNLDPKKPEGLNPCMF